MSDRFEQPRRADTETPEPAPRVAKPLPKPLPPLTDEERANGLRRAREARALLHGRTPEKGTP